LDRCRALNELCASRGNQQPELCGLVTRYSEALKGLRKDRGAYKLFLLGLDIEILLKSKSESPPDLERNPPIDADLLFSVRSLMVAHAGLVALFPDVRLASQELDEYRQLTEGLDAFKDRVLDAAVEKLAAAKDVFEPETQSMIAEIQSLSKIESQSGLSPSQGTAAVKHSWVRGSLSAIAGYLLGQTRKIAEKTRDAAVKETVSALFKNPDHLTAAMVAFLTSSKDTLITLAHKLPGTFGWLSSLMSFLGLG